MPSQAYEYVTQAKQAKKQMDRYSVFVIVLSKFLVSEGNYVTFAPSCYACNVLEASRQ